MFSPCAETISIVRSAKIIEWSLPELIRSGHGIAISANMRNMRSTCDGHGHCFMNISVFSQVCTWHVVTRSDRETPGASDSDIEFTFAPKE